MVSIIRNSALTMLIAAALGCTKTETKVRSRDDFNDNWKFILSDSVAYKEVAFNDSSWRTLDLPHDWSIEGEFSESNPSAYFGGALPGGIAWYRKSFSLEAADSARRIFITFDGVYHNSEVYINGHFLGKRPFGYIGFQYDMTAYLYFDGRPNLLAVRVDNSDQPNSRWYSGSGIYRNVWIEKTGQVYIDYNGTFVSATSVTDKSADVLVEATIRNAASGEGEHILETLILDETGRTVARTESTFRAPAGDTITIRQSVHISNPQLWSIEKPLMYKAVFNIYTHGPKTDTYETPFGIRYFVFDSREGFSLNGKPLKIKGVCNHHDLGALGAAINVRAMERQLEILKEMGCNAIRTSHNPPAPELLDLCDKMGFLVMDETFDVWAINKIPLDYSSIFNEWHVRDLTDHLLRDRNHPSIVMWSIGNEIREQGDTSALRIAPELTAIVKKYMPGIPVTSGLDHPEPSNFIYRSGALDLVGFNYHQQLYDSFPVNFPGKKFIATETTSSLNSRGMYDMPADSIRVWPLRWDLPFTQGNPDNSCSSYDNCRAPWGSTHEDTWRRIKKYDFLAGMFIWTGFDYLGEPTPYQWPSRSSYFGIVDLAGFPKDAYYLYQSEWTSKPVLHLLPHWNWAPGQMVDVWAYTNCTEVELFVNGKSQGKRSKGADDLHLAWKVKYEPGTLKAVGRYADGTTLTEERKTAGAASAIVLTADRATISAGGRDLSFITLKVVDKAGNLVPDANPLIEFETDNLLSIAGVDNGLQTSHESFKASSRKAYNGMCLLIVQSKDTKGKSVVKAMSKGLAGAEAVITVE